MKAVIIEDEPLVAKDLQKLVAQVNPEIDTRIVLSSVKESIDYFNKSVEPDLVFMDIQLSDGVSFDILKTINLKCPIIFTTAYDEYALRAFKVNSVDYLLKPIDVNELKLAIEKLSLLKTLYAGNENENIKHLVEQLNRPAKEPSYKDRFSVHSGKSFIIVNASAVAYFKLEALIYIVTTDKQQYITDFQTLEEVEDLLDPKLFFRANRQYILRADSVESYRTDSYGKLVVKLKKPMGDMVDVSREKARAFKNWLT